MKIAFLGNGNIGRPTFDIIYNKEGKFFKEHDIEIKYVLIKSMDEAPFEAPFFTTDFTKIENDPEIELVFEVMGARVSYDFIKRCILKKKSIITANKAVIADHFTELENLAKENGVKLFFEAAVGGGIPIITTLLYNNEVNNINRIEGIVNGTTNYIITSMEKDNLSYDEALKKAQKLGFAEADPSADVLGYDMVRKISILSQIAYGCEVDFNKAHIFGITNITKEFMNAANKLGRVVKYIASSEIKDNEVDVVVEPSLVLADDIVASVNYEFNFVRYFGDHSQKQLVYGKGAGPATANSLVNDLKLYVSGFDPYIVPYKNFDIVGNKNAKARYLISYNGSINQHLIEKEIDGFVVTKEIDSKTFNELMPNIKFYARFI